MNPTTPPLRDSRKHLHYTQERMAKSLGISLRTYCRQESGGGSMPLRTLASYIVQSASAVNHGANN